MMDGETPATDTESDDARLAVFKADLASTSVSLRAIVQRHITTGEPAAISKDVFFQLRNAVASKFDIHPSSVVLVGSCRLGFSLKKKGSDRYQPIQTGSDVDVAVVSDKLFDSYWQNVFDLIGPNQNWPLDRGKHFARELFHGWITPTELPNLPRFGAAKEWSEFFDGLTTSRICGIRKISARLYRDWHRLESYQEILVRQCRAELKSLAATGEATQ